eukprot:scaffold64461_cov35-Tisochrysis_lutea.AAC.4
MRISPKLPLSSATYNCATCALRYPLSLGRPAFANASLHRSKRPGRMNHAMRLPHRCTMHKGQWRSKDGLAPARRMAVQRGRCAIAIQRTR